jgi:hypothetical protein
MAFVDVIERKPNQGGRRWSAGKTRLGEGLVSQMQDRKTQNRLRSELPASKQHSVRHAEGHMRQPRSIGTGSALSGALAAKVFLLGSTSAQGYPTKPALVGE